MILLALAISVSVAVYFSQEDEKTAAEESTPDVTLITAAEYELFTGVVKGKVLDEEDKKGLSSIVVYVSIGLDGEYEFSADLTDEQAKFDHPYSDTTDEEGRFEISHLPEGSFAITARGSNGYKSQRGLFWIEEGGSTAAVSLQLTRTSRRLEVPGLE